MQENEFEKNVQRKLEELKLVPSEAVWQKIEPRIKKEKRRRWLLIFFPLLLIGSLYGGYVLINNNDTDPKAVHQVTQISNEKNTNTIPKKTQETRPVIDSTTASLISTGNKETMAQTADPKSSSHKKLKVKGKLNINTDHSIATTLVNNSSPVKTVPDTTKSTIETADVNTDTRDPEQEKALVTVETKPVDTTTQETGLPKQSDQDSTKNNIEVNTEKIPRENVVTTGNKDLTKNKYPWNWGFSFAAGSSGMANSLIGGIFGDMQKSMDLQYSNAGPGSPATGLVPKPTIIKSSLAFITGIAAEKNISKKTIFSTGLYYKRFNTTNRVGTDSVGFFRAYNYVKTYHNFYHYIELPVGFNFQVADLKKAKLYLNTGLSISQLISAKALQYNPITGLYYHDNSLFNKTQFGFNAGLDLAFFTEQKRSFLIGPYFNYGISKIAGEGYNKHHFSFIGLRAQYFFRKK